MSGGNAKGVWSGLRVSLLVTFMAGFSALIVCAAEAKTSIPRVADGYWTSCSKVLPYQSVGVLTHGVQCGRAKRVIKRSYSKGQEQANANGVVVVNGFRCKVSRRYGTPDTPERPLSCRKENKIILAPMPS